jgi:hypothetical protein
MIDFTDPLFIGLFRIECYAIREFVSKIAISLRNTHSFDRLNDMIEDALSVQWELSYEAGQQLSKLCQTLDVACVECKKQDASFIIDGKIFIRCCKRDRVLILMLALVPIPSVEKLSTDLSNIDLVVRLQQQVNPRMSSPTKRQREPDAAEMPESSKAKTEYSPLVPKRYTPEEFKVVEEVQGHTNLPLPGFTFTVNPDGNSISLSVEGCPDGQYNQGIRWIGQDWVCYMPRYICLRFVALLPVVHFIDFSAFRLLSVVHLFAFSLVSKRDSGGAIKELNKIAFKHPLTFEEGQALENQLVDALCKCDKLKTFVAKVLPTLKKTWPFADANYCGVGRTSSDKD